MNGYALNKLPAFGDFQGVHASQLLPVREQSSASSSEDDVTIEVTAENQRRQSLEQGGIHHSHPYLSTERHHSADLSESRCIGGEGVILFYPDYILKILIILGPINPFRRRGYGFYTDTSLQKDGVASKTVITSFGIHYLSTSGERSLWSVPSVLGVVVRSKQLR